MNAIELERMKSDFLKAGGHITHIPMGVSGEPDAPVTFNDMVVSAKNGSSLKELRAAHNRKLSAQIRERDSVDIKSIAKHLPDVETARALCKACHMSYDKLDRLLRTYFADDARAIPFLKISRDDREQRIKAEYPELRKTMARSECAKVLHIKYNELKRIIELYGLDNPKVLTGERQ